MKKTTYLSLILLTVVSLAACSGLNQAEQPRAKCPACGYEFDVSTKG